MTGDRRWRPSSPRLPALRSTGPATWSSPTPRPTMISVVAASTGTFYGQPMVAGELASIAGGGTAGCETARRITRGGRRCWAFRSRWAWPWPRTVRSGYPTRPTICVRSVPGPSVGSSVMTAHLVPVRRPSPARRTTPAPVRGRGGRLLVVSGCSSAAAPASGGTASVTSVAPKSGYLVYWDQDEEVDYYSSAESVAGAGHGPVRPQRAGVRAQRRNRSLHRGLGPDQSESAQSRGTSELSVQATARQRDGERRARPVHREDPLRPRARSGWHPVSRDRTLRRTAPASTTARRPTPGAPSTPSTTSSPATSGRHRVRSRSPPTVDWSSGSLLPTRPPACCYGPDTGGIGPNHTDGSGGLSQPGMMTTLPNGNVLVPQAGSASGGFPGNVLEFDHSSFPTSASQCPGGAYPRSDIRSSVFFQATTDDLPVPMGVALDPTCGCYAISSIFGGGSEQRRDQVVHQGRDARRSAQHHRRVPRHVRQ